jgi:hypothetical protein
LDSKKNQSTTSEKTQSLSEEKESFSIPQSAKIEENQGEKKYSQEENVQEKNGEESEENVEESGGDEDNSDLRENKNVLEFV